MYRSKKSSHGNQGFAKTNWNAFCYFVIRNGRFENKNIQKIEIHTAFWKNRAFWNVLIVIGVWFPKNAHSDWRITRISQGFPKNFQRISKGFSQDSRISPGLIWCCCEIKFLGYSTKRKHVIRNLFFFLFQNESLVCLAISIKGQIL